MNKNIQKYMLLLTIAGALLSMYLYYTDVLQVPSICPTDGCAAVASSPYSKFLGIHISLWGLIYYIFFASIFIFKDAVAFVNNNLNKIVGLLLAWGILFTLYLRGLEIFIIKAFCIWCWGSVLIVVLLSILYYLNYAQNVKNSTQTEG